MPSLEAEWATSALNHAEGYAARLAQGEAMCFFGSPEVDEANYRLFRRAFPTLDVRRLPQPKTSVDRYALEREWKPVLARLGGDSVLTLLRTSLDAEDYTIVPRAQWAAIELARCRERLYENVSQRAQVETCVKVVRDEGEARVVATRDLRAGQVVLREEAWAAAAYDERGYRDGGGCFHCARRYAAELMFDPSTKPACCDAEFCGEACRARHQARHERECKMLQAELPDDLPRFKVVLALRSYLASQGHQLKTHLADVRARRPDFLDAAQRAAEALGVDDRDALRDLVLAVDINAIALGDAGCGFGATSSAFNHSCLENVSHYAVWDDGAPTLVFRASRDVQAGDELTICYLGEDELAQPTRDRRTALRTYKHFECNCERCASEALDEACLEDAPRATDTLAEARRNARAALRLHPNTFSVAVAVAHEELGDLLAQCADGRDDARAAYELACRHFDVCRPDQECRRRAQAKLDALVPQPAGADQPPTERRDATAVFEVKPWEAVPASQLVSDLAARIRRLVDHSGVTWHPTARAVPLAYGISALVLSCSVTDHEKNDELFLRDLADAITEALPDDVQSVDLVSFGGAADS